MRVTNKAIYEAVKFNLANITEDLHQANTAVATAKRINELKDDPSGLTQVLNMKSSLSNIEQMGRNINLGKNWLTSAESALTQIQNLISDTKALCVQMASANISPDERASSAPTVQNRMDEIIALANTDVSGQYIFAGSKTESAPFSQSGTYNGDNDAFTIKIGKDATVEVGSDGSAVFLPSGAGANDDMFQTLSDLKTALESNDISGIQDAITNLDNHFNQLSTKISDIGSKMIRMEIKQNIFQELTITNTERLSSIEDVDITKAIMDLKVKEVAYQAALASSARVLNVSLMDYMR